MALFDNMQKALANANQTTGKSDTTLADGVKSLIAGYGGGSGGGIDTTTSKPAGPDDIYLGKEAFANGKKVTGSLYAFSGLSAEAKNINEFGQNAEIWSKPISGRKILEDGGNLNIKAPLSVFGDALASDVAKGKTFTSTAGVLIEGTKEGGGGGGGNNNCEAYVITPPNFKVSFKTSSGTIKAWGYAANGGSTSRAVMYAFQGDKYVKKEGFAPATTSTLSLTVDSAGNLQGLPAGLVDGTLLITRGV